MKLTTAILCLVLIGCATKPKPIPVYDYNDLPDGFERSGDPTPPFGSQDYQDGFRAGFYEGLTYSQAIQ